MTFIWPQAFWLLLALPPLLFLYAKGFRKREKLFARYPALMQASRPRTWLARVNRFVPPTLFFLAMTVLIVALARPAATITLAADRFSALGTSRAADYTTSWALETGSGWVTERLEVGVTGAYHAVWRDLGGRPLHIVLVVCDHELDVLAVDDRLR